MKKNTLFLFVFLTVAAVYAQLPSNYQLDQDWLLDNASFKAQVTEDEEKVVLSNGLIRRVIRLTPNAATVNFDNLMTGEAIIRAVQPEARVTLNGKSYPVGGLTGQPNRAFLTDQWLDQLKAFPEALRFVGMETGVPKERFPWKKTRRHAPNTHWPPKGVSLRMDYVMPTQAEVLAEKPQVLDSDKGRSEFIRDEFNEISSAWKAHASKSHPRSSFENEGKPGEIYTPANTSVYVERDFPPQARLVEATIDVGDDRSAEWGPGLALVWPQRTVKFFMNYDPKAKATKFALWDGSRERILGKNWMKVDVSKPCIVRIRMQDNKIYFESRPKGAGKWLSLGQMDMDSALGTPKRVRVGKMSLKGEGEDAPGDKGELVRLRVIDFSAYGELEKNKLAGRKLSPDQEKIRVSVHYEIYDGIPLISKWVTVYNGTEKQITVDKFTAEELSVVEYDNPVTERPEVPMTPPDILHVETDMAFKGFTFKDANAHAIHWRTEPQYSTQVNWARKSPCRLVVEPTYGPSQDVKPGKTFESFRVFELVYDSSDRQRRNLALAQMYRTIAPWVTENPLMMHMRTAKPDLVLKAIDQCDEVGFELLILSFRSGFHTESTDPEYLAKWKKIADYAHSKGIHMGSYSLLSSRGVKPASDMIVSPEGQRPTHGRCPALASEWGQEYFKRLRNLFEKTGFDFFEHDGSYPGDVDITARPPLQKGINDSRWVQWRIITDFYQWLRARGAYMNVPDFYYLAGVNKCGMGYRENNWGLPRNQQLIHTRQNIYDGTWTKTPSMGWMFVPLTVYHGGGAAATIEPLDEHRDHYEAMLNSNLGLGVQACYRGPRLYDTDRTKKMLKGRVDWFKKHRDILESDMVHGRRADGRDIDWMLHVNPNLKEKGFLSIYNPTDHAITKTIRVPLYYTGLAKTAVFQGEQGAAKPYTLDENKTVKLKITVPANGFLGYAITQ